MRNLNSVIESIRTQIPHENPWYYSITSELDKLASSVPYTAPELIAAKWSTLQSILANYIGTPDRPWKVRIQNIFNGTVEV